MLFLLLLADHVSPFPLAVFASFAMFTLSASHISSFCYAFLSLCYFGFFLIKNLSPSVLLLFSQMFERSEGVPIPEG